MQVLDQRIEELVLHLAVVVGPEEFLRLARLLGLGARVPEADRVAGVVLLDPRRHQLDEVLVLAPGEVVEGGDLLGRGQALVEVHARVQDRLQVVLVEVHPVEEVGRGAEVGTGVDHLAALGALLEVGHRRLVARLGDEGVEIDVAVAEDPDHEIVTRTVVRGEAEEELGGGGAGRVVEEGAIARSGDEVVQLDRSAQVGLRQQLLDGRGGNGAAEQVHGAGEQRIGLATGEGDLVEAFAQLFGEGLAVRQRDVGGGLRVGVQRIGAVRRRGGGGEARARRRLGLTADDEPLLSVDGVRVAAEVHEQLPLGGGRYRVRRLGVGEQRGELVEEGLVVHEDVELADVKTFGTRQVGEVAFGRSAIGSRAGLVSRRLAADERLDGVQVRLRAAAEQQADLLQEGLVGARGGRTAGVEGAGALELVDLQPTLLDQGGVGGQGELAGGEGARPGGSALRRAGRRARRCLGRRLHVRRRLRPVLARRGGARRAPSVGRRAVRVCRVSARACRARD